MAQELLKKGNNEQMVKLANLQELSQQVYLYNKKLSNSFFQTHTPTPKNEIKK